jgi:hypothetical protein
MTTAMPGLSAPPPLDDGYDPTGKSSAEIESDIGRTRADLGLLIAAIERKFTPRHLLDQGIDMLQDAISAKSGRIGDALRDNPLPLALIGAGIGWMAISNAAGDHAAPNRERSTPADGTGVPDETMNDYAYARVKPALPRSEKPGAPEAADRAADDSDTGFVARIARTVAVNPLALGAMGLLAGAALALWLPTSRAEEKLLGPARKQLRDQARALGLEAAERARQAAERAADAATEAILQAARRETGSRTR